MHASAARPYRYFDYLKYHLLIVGLPVLFSGLLLLNTIRKQYNNLVQVLSRLLHLEGGRDSWDELFGAFFALSLFATLLSLFIRVLKSGLYFLPALGAEGGLTAGAVIKLGMLRFLPVFLVTLGAGLAVGVVSTVLAFIPLLNLAAVLIIPYLAALCSIGYDYVFSANLLSRQSMFADLDKHVRYLFGTHREFWIYAALLALSYTVAASLFVKPYIQLKLADRLQADRAAEAAPARRLSAG